MLRSLLSLRLSREQATRIASYTGQTIALLMLVYGVMNTHPTMTLIGVFIFFAARNEYQVIARQARMTRTHARDIMEPVEHLLFTQQLLSEAREIAQSRPDLSYVVWSRPGVPSGYITRDSLLHASPPPLPESVIDAWVIPAPYAISPDLTVAQVYSIMQQHKLPLVLVYDQANCLGVIHWEKMKSLLK